MNMDVHESNHGFTDTFVICLACFRRLFQPRGMTDVIREDAFHEVHALTGLPRVMDVSSDTRINWNLVTIDGHYSITCVKQGGAV